MWKNSWNRADRVLLGLAAAAVIFAAVMGVRLAAFPAGEYDARRAETLARAEEARQETRDRETALTQRQTQLRADLRSGGDEGAELADRLDELEAAIAGENARLEERRLFLERMDDLPAVVAELRHAYGLAIRALEEKIQAGDSPVKICYWTLDDGPTNLTSAFLDTARDLGIKFTFFTANEANGAPHEEELLRRETMEGHSVQNHSFSHQYTGNVYTSLESFIEQVRLQDEWVFECTGFHPGIFRFPGGSAWARGLREDAIAALEEMGYQWIDWSCNAFDSGPEETLPRGDGLAWNIRHQVESMPIAVLLSHDWNSYTYGVVEMVVPQLRESGYVFLPLFPESVTMGENTKIIFTGN